MPEFTFCERKRKYNNQKSSFNGINFDSKIESEVYCILAADGNVSKVETHVSYPIKINDTKICNVIVDFRVHFKNGSIELADAKALNGITETSTSKLKFKLIEALYKKKVWILPKQIRLFSSKFLNENIFVIK